MKLRKLILSFLIIFSQNIFALPNPKNIYWVILAGGSGTRLWPLSRLEFPKQFLSVTDKSLLKQSIERLKFYPNFSKTHIYISTEKGLRKHFTSMKEEGIEFEGIIEEPSRRDTGPAILLATLEIMKKDPHAYIMFLPADHYIPPKDYSQFGSYLQQMMQHVEEKNKIVLLGKTPKYPATGFGYIEYAQDAVNKSALQAVVKFHEKPKEELAKKYLDQGNTLWNIGIFAGKAETFSKLFKKYANNIYKGIEQYVQGTASYQNVEKKSVDFAIMEPSSKVGKLAVLPTDNFEWQDVGNINSYLAIQDQYLEAQNIEKPKIITKDAMHNKVFLKNKKKLVSFIGVDNLCVVDTDDVLLVTDCDQAEKIKTVVNDMNQNKEKYASFL